MGGRPVKDYSGLRFGNLEVVELAHVRNGGAYFYCKCDCGKSKIISGNHLQKGATKTCGCRMRNRKW